MARAAIWSLVVLATLASLVWGWISLPYGPFSYFLFMAALAAFPLPLLLVLRWNLRGVLAGSVLIFCSLMVVRRIGEGLDPTFHGDDAITYAEKTVGLSIMALIFPLVAYAAKRIWLRMAAKIRERRTG